MKWIALIGLALACSGHDLLSAQDFSDIAVEKAAVGFHFTEGPVWSRENYLVFSDIPANKLVKWVPGEGSSALREDSNGANGNTFDAQGRLYTCESHSRRVVRLDKKGKTEVLADKWEGKRFNGPSDIVVRHDGEIYFTDPAFGNQSDTRELDFYGVFHITRKGALQLLGKSTARPHGIALAPNGKTLYVSYADDHNVRAFDLDKNGDPSNERVLIANIGGVPGGIRVDENGNLYVVENGITIFTPAGKKLGELPVGETASNCAFGDADFQSLYITARSTVYRIRLKVKGSVQY